MTEYLNFENKTAHTLLYYFNYKDNKCYKIDNITV